VGGGEAPRRLRVLDLPFSAVEWALPGDAPQLAPEGLPPDRWALFARSPLARERSMTGSGCRSICRLCLIHMLAPSAWTEVGRSRRATHRMTDSGCSSWH
jgi:hypothetical protein